MMPIDAVVSAIRKHKRFLISSHINLEGDSLGSLVAMHELLRSMGKEAFVFCDALPPKQYKFLQGAMKVRIPSGQKVSPLRAEGVPLAGRDVPIDPKAVPAYDAAIILDCPRLERIGRISEAIDASKPILNIDHHISNSDFADVNWVDVNASCVGEMVYRLYLKFRRRPNGPAALGMYVAILTDTGSFRYENATPACLETAAQLLRLGINPQKVSEHVYETKSYSETRLLGEAISTMKLASGGRVAYFYATRDMFKKMHATPQESERFINFARAIEGVEVAVFFRETENPNSIKASLRSKGRVDVNKIAKVFGGGGHRAASGCEIRASLRDAIRMVLSQVRKAINVRP